MLYISALPTRGDAIFSLSARRYYDVLYGMIMGNCVYHLVLIYLFQVCREGNAPPSAFIYFIKKEWFDYITSMLKLNSVRQLSKWNLARRQKGLLAGNWGRQNVMTTALEWNVSSPHTEIIQKSNRFLFLRIVFLIQKNTLNRVSSRC